MLAAASSATGDFKTGGLVNSTSLFSRHLERLVSVIAAFRNVTANSTYASGVVHLRTGHSLEIYVTCGKD